MIPPSSHRQRRRSLRAMFASTFAELVGLFLFAPLLLFMLRARGLDEAATGAFAALQWAGILVATPFASQAVQRLGSRRALLVSGAVPLGALLAILASDALALWALMQCLSGVATALRWILAEATVAELAGERHRGRIMGLFATMIGVTFMLGPALLSAALEAGCSTAAIGWIAAAIVALGVVLLLPVRPAALPQPHTAAATGAVLGWRGTRAALRAAPVVMVAGLVGGFFEAGLAGVLPLWGLALGESQARAALLVTASGVGSTLVAAPIGELADRLPRETVRRACAAVCLAGAATVPWTPALGAWAAAVVAFAWGGAGAALYTLAMTEIGDRHQGVALVNSTSVLVLAYTAGGLLAPALGGAMLQFSPRWGFALLLALAAAAGLRRAEGFR